MRRSLPGSIRKAKTWSGLALALALVAASLAWDEYGHLLQPAEPAADTYSVYDGDTIKIGRERIRIIGLDTPEIGSGARCVSEARAAEAARSALVRLLAGAEITLRRDGTDKYGRTLAYVYADRRDVAGELIAAGLARPYNGGHREGWCD